MLCKICPTGASDYLLKTSERNPEAVAIYRNVDNTETDGRAPPVCRRGVWWGVRRRGSCFCCCHFHDATLLFYFHSPPVTGSECCAASLGELFPVNGVIVFCARWCLCLWVSWVSLSLNSLDVFQSSAPVAFCVNNSCARPRRSAEPLLVTRNQLISYVNVSTSLLTRRF